jgi:hypothetical protein
MDSLKTAINNRNKIRLVSNELQWIKPYYKKEDPNKPRNTKWIGIAIQNKFEKVKKRIDSINDPEHKK